MPKCIPLVQMSSLNLLSVLSSCNDGLACPAFLLSSLDFHLLCSLESHFHIVRIPRHGLISSDCYAVANCFYCCQTAASLQGHSHKSRSTSHAQQPQAKSEESYAPPPSKAELTGTQAKHPAAQPADFCWPAPDPPCQSRIRPSTAAAAAGGGCLLHQRAVELPLHRRNHRAHSFLVAAARRKPRQLARGQRRHGAPVGCRMLCQLSRHSAHDLHAHRAGAGLQGGAGGAAAPVQAAGQVLGSVAADSQAVSHEGACPARPPACWRAVFSGEPTCCSARHALCLSINTSP